MMEPKRMPLVQKSETTFTPYQSKAIPPMIGQMLLMMEPALPMTEKKIRLSQRMEKKELE